MSFTTAMSKKNAYFSMLNIIELIKWSFTRLTKRNLPIFGVPSKDLRSYCTSEKDALNEISWMPLRVNRIWEERVLDDADSDDDDEEDKELFEGFVMIE